MPEPCSSSFSHNTNCSSVTSCWFLLGPHPKRLARRRALRPPPPPTLPRILLRFIRLEGLLLRLPVPPHAFESDPHRIAGVREEPRLREQDFGNFQDREQMRVEKETRLRYGRFFYRFPNGESAADVYDRITGFRETLRADIDIGRFQPPGEHSRNMNVVLVSHGLTLRVFLMRWYKWTVRQFEGINNFRNGDGLVMQTGEGGRYSLLVHHTEDELRQFGFTDEMIQDQMWQKTAKPGDLNYDFMTDGQSFFDKQFHLADL